MGLTPWTNNPFVTRIGAVRVANTGETGLSWALNRSPAEGSAMAIPVPRGRGLECAGEAAGLLDAPVSDSPAQRVSVLVKTIERDVIPRLMLVHRQGAAAAPAPGYTPDAGDVELLVGYLLKGDAAGASAFIRRLRERGATPEVLLLALLAPAA